MRLFFLSIWNCSVRLNELFFFRPASAEASKVLCTYQNGGVSARESVVSQFNCTRSNCHVNTSVGALVTDGSPGDSGVHFSSDPWRRDGGCARLIAALSVVLSWPPISSASSRKTSPLTPARGKRREDENISNWCWSYASDCWAFSCCFPLQNFPLFYTHFFSN